MPSTAVRVILFRLTENSQPSCQLLAGDGDDVDALSRFRFILLDGVAIDPDLHTGGVIPVAA